MGFARKRERDEVIENHKRLIGVMEALPIEKHDQATWGVYKGIQPDLACGTAACALGWAALSEEIPGFGAMPSGLLETVHIQGEHCDGGRFVAYLDGEAVTWEGSATHLFGLQTSDAIFFRTSLSKDEVINKLKSRLASLEAGGPL